MAIRSTSSRLCVDTSTIRRSCRRRRIELAHLARALRIESGGRLVEQDDVRLVQQRARQRDALLQALREMGGGVAGAVAHVERVERCVHRPLRIGQPVQPRVDEQVLPHVQAFPEAWRFGEEPDAAAQPRCVARRQRLAADADRCRRSAGSVPPASAASSSCRRRSVRAAQRSRRAPARTTRRPRRGGRRSAA